MTSGFQWTPAQELAIRTEGHDVLVAAGAGAGKTTVLVERILRKLRDGSIDDLEQILVVTFTEKAARQMKSRLHEALTKDPELRHHLPQLSRARISTIHAFCARLLRENFLLAGVEPGFHVLDEHGRTEALEEALRQTFHHWYVRDDELGAEFGRLVELAGFDEQGESLRVLVRRLHEFARTTIDPEAYLDRLADTSSIESLTEIPWVEELEARLYEKWSTGRALYEEMVRELDAASLKTKVQYDILEALHGYPEQPLLGGLSGARSAANGSGDHSADETLESGSGVRYLEELERRGRLNRKGKGGQGGSESKGTPAFDWGRLPSGGAKIPGVSALHETAKKLIDSVVKMLDVDAADLVAEESRRRRSLHVLVRLVREMDSIYEAYKRRGGWLDYSDLEVHAARILSPATLLDVRFREVLVDEYQDVNALQERILSAVASPSGSFRVGDVKQSIYGFRLADPSIFLSVMRGSTPLRTKEDQVPETSPVAIFMNENYRSRPGVLRVVNELFGRLFDARTIGSAYAEQALLPGRGEAACAESGAEGDLATEDTEGVDTTSRDTAEAGPMSTAPATTASPVELHFIDIQAGKDRAAGLSMKQLAVSDAWIDPTELEPRYVARRLRALALDPVLRSSDTGEGGDGPDWSRVAILLRSSTRAPLFADALRREGIPVELTGGGSLFEEPIVRDLRSVLRVIDNPRDDVALAATLRTPALRFGNADLLRIRLAFPGARSFLDAVLGVAYGDDEIPTALAPPGEPERFGQPDAEWLELVSRHLRRGCRSVLEMIAKWRKEEPWSELPRFVARVADWLHLVPIGFASGEGSRQRACLERFLGLARAYESERGPSLHGFLGRIDLLDEADAVETVPATRGESRGVRILTVHKSKGLEFPVVVVPQLDWRVSTKDRLASRIRIDRDWVGLRWFDETTYTRRESVVRQLLEWRQEEALREEEARILYVAMTRAEEKLLLFGMHRGLPESKALPEGVWDHERRHASTMLTWIVGALPWSEMRPVEPDLLSALRLAPAETLTLAEYHSRYGTGDPPLPAEEMAASPQRSAEYQLGDIRVSLVSKVVLAASLAEAALDSAAAADSASRAETASAAVACEAASDREPAVGQTYDMFASLTGAADDPGPTPTSTSESRPDSPPAPVSAAASASAKSPNVVSATTDSHTLDDSDLEDDADATDADAIDAALARAARRRPIPPVARLTLLRGKYWVTEFKSETDFERMDALRDEATAFWLAADDPTAGDPTADGTAASDGSASIPVATDSRAARASLGTLYHGWLARVPFASLSAEGIRAALDAEVRSSSGTETRRGAETRRDDEVPRGEEIPRDEETLRDEEIEAGLEAFFRSEWGARLQAAGERIEREVPFSLKWTVDELCHALPALRQEIEALDDWSEAEWAAELARHWALLQGRLDCVFPYEDGWVVLDWKTDRVNASTIDARAETYANQMRFYRDAVRKLWGGPVTSVLVFVRTGDVCVTGGR